MARKINSKGFTLVELMVALSVFGITLGVAVPSFKYLTDRYRIKGAAEALYYSLHTARTQAIKSNSTITAAFQTGSNWTARLSDSPTCAINSGTCSGTEWTNQILGNEFKGTQITATTFTANNTAFDPKRGTANSGAVTLALNDYTVQVRLNVLGNPRYCAADSASVSATGYPAC